VFIFSLFLSFSSLKAGTILSSYKYAWANNVGYINFENVTVSDTKLSGFAWSASKGFIKFDPAMGGVSNDSTGNLSGFAWGEQLGWIDFNGVSINGSTGKLSGSATGTLVGTINFDCPTYCDVRTDWRTPSTPAPSTSSSGGGGFISSIINSLTSNKVEVHNELLTITPKQSGSVTQDMTSGKLTLEIPADTLEKKTTFAVAEEPVISNNTTFLVTKGTELVNNSFYNITATNENGEAVHFFSNPISITLPIPKNLVNETNLEVYWLNETNWQWVLIPDATFVNGEVKFKVSHLTKFAIFKKTNTLVKSLKVVTPSLSLPASKKPKVTAVKEIAVADTASNSTLTESKVTSGVIKNDKTGTTLKVGTTSSLNIKETKENEEVPVKSTSNKFSSILVFLLVIFLAYTLNKIFTKDKKLG
ncbi:MAG: hypothetical protein WCK60_03650, partial [Candidatus Nomurabacteria bacterium]